MSNLENKLLFLILKFNQTVQKNLCWLDEPLSLEVSVVVIHVDVVIVFSEVCEGLLTGTAENKNDKKRGI